MNYIISEEDRKKLIEHLAQGNYSFVAPVIAILSQLEEQKEDKKVSAVK